MKLAIVGSRYFGATVFEALRKEPGVQIVGVVAPEEDDRLANAARAALARRSSSSGATTPTICTPGSLRSASNTVAPK